MSGDAARAEALSSFTARKPLPPGRMRRDGLFSGRGWLCSGELGFEAWLAKVHEIRDRAAERPARGRSR